MKALALLALFALCACSSLHELAKCKGPLVAINADHWRPTATELDALDKLCPEDR